MIKRIKRFEFGKYYKFVGNKDKYAFLVEDILNGKSYKYIGSEKFDENTRMGGKFEGMKYPLQPSGKEWIFDLHDWEETDTPQEEKNMINKFEVGKWYLYIGKKEDLHDSIRDIADGKPHQCIKIGPRSTSEFSDMKHRSDKSSGFIMWSWDRSDFVEVKEPSLVDKENAISKPKKQNKYRQFTQDDVGKTFTVRQWDDMVDEFGLDHGENIQIRNNNNFKKIYFSNAMKNYCGMHIKIHSLNYIKSECKTIGNDYFWIPEMFEECIIKDDKMACDDIIDAKKFLQIRLKWNDDKSFKNETPMECNDNLWNKALEWKTGSWNGLCNPEQSDKLKLSKDLIVTEKLHFNMEK